VKLNELMTTQVVSISPDADLVEAAQLMRKQHVGMLVVIRPAARGTGALAGVLTDRDIIVQTLARDVDPHSVTVAAIMTTDVLTGREDETLPTLLARMRRAGIHRVPIVNGAGQVRGVLSLDDALRYVAELSGLLAETVRLSRRLEKRRRGA